MADLATALHHPHPHVRHFAGLAQRAKALVARERTVKQTVKTRGLHTAEAAGASALLAVVDHYFGGEDGELTIGPVPVGPAVGAALSVGAFFFGGDAEWADHVAAVGDALIAAGTYGWVRSLLEAHAGGK